MALKLQSSAELGAVADNDDISWSHLWDLQWKEVGQSKTPISVLTHVI